MGSNLDVAKKANDLVSKVVGVVTEAYANKHPKVKKEDIARFNGVNEIFSTACSVLQKNVEKEALLAGWMVSMANNAAFLLWRRDIMTEEVNALYRELPSTEEAMEEFNKIQEQNQAIAKDLETQRREFMDKQHEIDIFKAILNGMSKQEAEAKLKEQQEMLAQAMKG